MSDIEPLLSAIEDNPTDDLAWQILADWLEERGDPYSEILRQAVADRDWPTAFDEISRSLTMRQMQLVACEVVEPLLPHLERRFPRNRAARQLVEGLKVSQELAEIRALNRDLSGLSWQVETTRRWNIPGSQLWNSLDSHLAKAAAHCLALMIGGPRRACNLAAVALAHEKSGTTPSRNVAAKKAGPLRDAIEFQYRRVIVKAIRRRLDPPSP